MSYREVAPMLLRLAALDAEIQEHRTNEGYIDRSLEDLRCEADRISLELEEQKRVAAKESSGAAGTEIADEQRRYKVLFEHYEAVSHDARFRRQILERDISSLELQRSQLLARLPPEMVAIYDGLERDGRRPAIAALTFGRCAGCNERVGLVVYSALVSTDGPLRCPGCGRLLIPASWKKVS